MWHILHLSMYFFMDCPQFLFFGDVVLNSIIRRAHVEQIGELLQLLSRWTSWRWLSRTCNDSVKCCLQKVILKTTFDHFSFFFLTLQTITFYSFWFHGDVAQTICKSKGCVRSSQDFLTYEDLHTLKWNFLVLPFMEKMGFFLRTDVHWANCEGCHQYN